MVRRCYRIESISECSCGKEVVPAPATWMVQQYACLMNKEEREEEKKEPGGRVMCCCVSILRPAVRNEE